MDNNQLLLAAANLIALRGNRVDLVEALREMAANETMGNACITRIEQLERKLLPCPFCGGDAQTDFIDDMASYIVECRQCEGRSASFDTAEQAVTAWQARAALRDEIEEKLSQQAEPVHFFRQRTGGTWLEIAADRVEALRAANTESSLYIFEFRTLFTALPAPAPTLPVEAADKIIDELEEVFCEWVSPPDREGARQAIQKVLIRAIDQAALLRNEIEKQLIQKAGKP